MKNYSRSAKRRRASKVYRMRRWYRPPHGGQRGPGRKRISKGR